MKEPEMEDLMPKERADLLGPAQDTEGHGPEVKLPDDFTAAPKPEKSITRAENMG